MPNLCLLGPPFTLDACVELGGKPWHVETAVLSRRGWQPQPTDWLDFNRHHEFFKAGVERGMAPSAIRAVVVDGQLKGYAQFVWSHATRAERWRAPRLAAAPDAAATPPPPQPPPPWA